MDTGPLDTGPSIREANVQAFLDAAERLLIREGAAGISTRQLAREAGQNHGLVHYYFGSVDELLLQTLERRRGQNLAGVRVQPARRLDNRNQLVAAPVKWEGD